MYSSEYLRNKKLATSQVISPPIGRPSSLWTQIRRYKSALPVTPLGSRNGTNMLELSNDGVLAKKAQASVCCANTITASQTIAGCCAKGNGTNLVPTGTQQPRGFYGPVRPDCCPVNNPPITTELNCVNCPPTLPHNSSLITWTKPPTTQG